MTWRDRGQSRGHLNTAFAWHTWRTDTEQFCKACAPCNQDHLGKVPKPGLLQDMRVGEPWKESMLI